MTDYPGSIFNASAAYQVDNVDDAEAEDINILYDEVEAIETELGINPRKGGIAIDGWSEMGDGIILKGTTSQRTSEDISYIKGQVFYDTTADSLYKRSADGLGNDGNWDLITASGSPGNHVSQHLPSGGDALTTAVPDAVQIGDSQQEGTNNSLARSDHVHACAAGTPVKVQDANSAGSALTHARSDHVHLKHDDTPTADQKDALDSSSGGAGTPSSSNVYTTKSYVDNEVQNAAGLCLVVGNETEVNTSSLSATTLKNHRFLYTSTVLPATTIKVAAELYNAGGGSTTTLEVHINGAARITLISTSSSYELKSGTWTIAGLTDDTAYTVEVKLKTGNVGNAAYNRSYEFYMQ
jgi:hypothetical protein